MEKRGGEGETQARKEEKREAKANKSSKFAWLRPAELQRLLPAALGSYSMLLTDLS